MMVKVNESQDDIDLFKEKVKREAEELVITKFPRKILELNALLKEEKFSLNSDLTRVSINIPVPDPPKSPNEYSLGEELPHLVKRPNLQEKSCSQVENDKNLVAKHFLFPTGAVQCNKHLVELIEILKPLMLELIQDTVLLKMGINLMVPKIEDGNNFGVEIQEEVIDFITSIEDDVDLRLSSITNYFILRGDLISKVAKYPHAEDYRHAVEERDEKFHLYLRLSLTHIRNYYTSLHDLVTKNLSKIKKPRSRSNKEMLY